MTKRCALSSLNYQEVFPYLPEYFTIPPNLLTTRHHSQGRVSEVMLTYKRKSIIWMYQDTEVPSSFNIWLAVALPIFLSFVQIFQYMKKLTWTYESVILLSTIPTVDCKSPPIPVCIPLAICCISH